ncbi:hypothetical protein Q7560_09195, partial [Glaesserella parasuis]|nr:hypothetical protein [Glaesserella parasuis]
MNTLNNIQLKQSIFSKIIFASRWLQLPIYLAGQPHMLSIFQPTRRATAHLEIHLTNQQRSISLSYSAFSGVI